MKRGQHVRKHRRTVRKTGKSFTAGKRHPLFIIEGKRWFDRVNGNTYHSTSVYKMTPKGKVLIGTDPFSYGYGDQYIQTAHEILQSKGYFPKTDQHLTSGADKDYHEFMMDMREHRDKFVINVADVPRKRDL